MELSHDIVRSVAELSRLDLTDKQTALYADQLSQILTFFEYLQTADTAYMGSIVSVLPVRTVLRRDVAGKPLPRNEVLANATDTQQDQFRVNTVFDG